MDVSYCIHQIAASKEHAEVKVRLGLDSFFLASLGIDHAKVISTYQRLFIAMTLCMVYVSQVTVPYDALLLQWYDRHGKC